MGKTPVRYVSACGRTSDHRHCSRVRRQTWIPSETRLPVVATCAWWLTALAKREEPQPFFGCEDRVVAKKKFRTGRASYKIDMPTMSSILEAEQDGAAIGMRMAASVTQIGWLWSLNSCGRGRRRLRQPHFTGGNRSPLRGVFFLDAFRSTSADQHRLIFMIDRSGQVHLQAR